MKSTADSMCNKKKRMHIIVAQYVGFILYIGFIRGKWLRYDVVDMSSPFVFLMSVTEWLNSGCQCREK